MGRNRSEDDEDDTELEISSDDGADDEGADDGDEGEEEDDGSDLGNQDGDEDDDGEEEEADGEDDEGEEDESEEGDETEEEGDDEDELDPDLNDLANEDEGAPKTVPYARFAEVLERLKALEEGKATKDERGQEIPAFDLKAKLKEKNEALLEGDTEKATEIDLEVAAHQQRVSDARADARVAADRQQRSIDKAVAQVQKKHPALNDAKGNKAFDPEALADVIALRDGYIARGMPVQAALMKAADRYFGRKGAAKAGDEPKDKGGDKGGKKKLSETERLRKLLRAKRAGQQPPGPLGKRGAGNRTSKIIDHSNINLDDMSDEQLEELARTNPKLMAKLDGSAV